MKNINVSSVTDKQEPVDVIVQFKITEWSAKKTLESLNNPVDIVEARSVLSQLILEKHKNFLNYFPLEDSILDKVLVFAFEKNISVWKAIDLFIRQKSPNIAKAKIDTIMELGKIANNPSYTSVTDEVA